MCNELDLEELQVKIKELQLDNDRLKQVLRNSAKCLVNQPINAVCNTLWYDRWTTLYDYMMQESGGWNDE